MNGATFENREETLVKQIAMSRKAKWEFPWMAKRVAVGIAEMLMT